MAVMKRGSRWNASNPGGSLGGCDGVVVVDDLLLFAVAVAVAVVVVASAVLLLVCGSCVVVKSIIAFGDEDGRCFFALCHPCTAAVYFSEGVVAFLFSPLALLPAAVVMVVAVAAAAAGGADEGTAERGRGNTNDELTG